MKIQNLRFFAAVIEFGGVTQAAEHLRVSQPAVSAGLKALERELGEPLFDRSGGRRRMVPTTKALRFHREALNILNQCEAALRSFRITEARSQTVRLGILRTISADAVAAVSANLAQSTTARWQIREGGAEELLRWLRQGRVDVAWTTVQPKTPNAQTLWHEPFVVLTARGHPLIQRRNRAVNLKDLDGERLVLRGSCELKPGELQSAGIKVRIAARTHRDDLAIQLVAKGLGIAVAPVSLATHNVEPVALADLGLTRSIGLRWRADLDATVVATVRAAIVSFGRPKALR